MVETMSQEPMDRRKHPDYSGITAYIPKVKIRELKSLAALQDKTLSEVVEDAISEWLAKYGTGL